jgi:hypothetical protein
MRNELTACNVEREGLASGIALVIHASRRRMNDLLIEGLECDVKLWWNESLRLKLASMSRTTRLYHLHALETQANAQVVLKG